MKRIFWYSGMNGYDYDCYDICKLIRLGVTDVVIDFELTSSAIPQALKSCGIKSWYRIKIYDQPTKDQIIKWLNTCYHYRCLPAIDCEPYDNSDVYLENTYIDDFIEVLENIEQNPCNVSVVYPLIFSEITIYPEIMTGKKYRLYNYFIYRLSDTVKCNINVLMELTYSKLFNLRKYYRENSKALRDTVDYGITPFVGIWPQSLWKPFRKLQVWVAKKLFDNLFFYTETKELF